MKPGAVIRLRNFRHYTGQKLGIQNMDYSAPPGKVFLAVLIGVDEKQEEDQKLDAVWCLNDLGWYASAQLIQFFGDEKMREFGKTIDAVRSDHRATAERNTPPIDRKHEG